MSWIEQMRAQSTGLDIPDDLHRRFIERGRGADIIASIASKKAVKVAFPLSGGAELHGFDGILELLLAKMPSHLSSLKRGKPRRQVAMWTNAVTHTRPSPTRAALSLLRPRYRVFTTLRVRRGSTAKISRRKFFSLWRTSVRKSSASSLMLEGYGLMGKRPSYASVGGRRRRSSAQRDGRQTLRCKGVECVLDEYCRDSPIPTADSSMETTSPRESVVASTSKAVEPAPEPSQHESDSDNIPLAKIAPLSSRKSVGSEHSRHTRDSLKSAGTNHSGGITTRARSGSSASAASSERPVRAARAPTPLDMRESSFHSTTSSVDSLLSVNNEEAGEIEKPLVEEVEQEADDEGEDDVEVSRAARRRSSSFSHALPRLPTFSPLDIDAVFSLHCSGSRSASIASNGTSSTSTSHENTPETPSSEHAQRREPLGAAFDMLNIQSENPLEVPDSLAAGPRRRTMAAKEISAPRLVSATCHIKTVPLAVRDESLTSPPPPEESERWHDFQQRLTKIKHNVARTVSGKWFVGAGGLGKKGSEMDEEDFAAIAYAEVFGHENPRDSVVEVIGDAHFWNRSSIRKSVSVGALRQQHSQLHQPHREEMEHHPLPFVNRNTSTASIALSRHALSPPHLRGQRSSAHRMAVLNSQARDSSVLDRPASHYDKEALWSGGTVMRDGRPIVVFQEPRRIPELVPKRPPPQPVDNRVPLIDRGMERHSMMQPSTQRLQQNPMLRKRSPSHPEKPSHHYATSLMRLEGAAGGSHPSRPRHGSEDRRMTNMNYERPHAPPLSQSAARNTLAMPAHATKPMKHAPHPEVAMNIAHSGSVEDMMSALQVPPARFQVASMHMDEPKHSLKKGAVEREMEPKRHPPMREGPRQPQQPNHLEDPPEVATRRRRSPPAPALSHSPADEEWGRIHQPSPVRYTAANTPSQPPPPSQPLPPPPVPRRNPMRQMHVRHEKGHSPVPLADAAPRVNNVPAFRSTILASMSHHQLDEVMRSLEATM
ncbi:uncharacterized protein VTP21DRAFT_4737 [Calcarisporiella thermophila]|uniref:uncharacterized protein n=1 Tax=Calcarisporiella thermophila TaxID=911321 RepID=UPI003744A583